MPQFITSQTVTVGDNLTLSDIDFTLITKTAEVFSTSSRGIATTGTTPLIVEGTVAGVTGVESSIASFMSIRVGETGAIYGSGRGVRLDGDDAVLSNFGTIHGTINGARFRNDDVGAQFTNRGTITSDAFGSFAVDIEQKAGASNRSINYGLIEGAGGVQFFRNSADSALFLDNFGTITGFDGTAIRGDFDEDDAVFNAGLVNGDIEQVAGNDTLTNTGDIIGDVSFTSGTDVVRNTGTIIGDITMGVDNDSFDGRGGTVIGEVLGGDGNDTLRGGAEEDTLSGELDDDFVTGGAGNDEISGGDGFDRLYGGTGDDTIDGGLDNDTVYGGAGNDAIDGGFGNDSLMGGLGDDTVMTGDGNDFVKAGKGDDIVTTGTDNGNDTIYGQGGDDDIDAGGGFDMLVGGHGNDTLSGGGRSDTIEGGVGDDEMIGGGGGDTFVFLRGNNGDDIVVDFQDGIDRLDISDLGVFNFGRISTAGAVSQDTDAAIIDLSLIGGNGSITLLGLQANDLSGADFIF